MDFLAKMKRSMRTTTLSSPTAADGWWSQLPPTARTNVFTLVQQVRILKTGHELHVTRTPRNLLFAAIDPTELHQATLN